MGLDNGIMIRRNKAAERHYDKLMRFEFDWDKNHQEDFEVCYWRKCWNVRAAIERIIDGDINQKRTSLSTDHISEIIDFLASLNEDNWEDWGSSIWEFEEQQPFLCQQVADLMDLLSLMEEEPEIEVYFYDSY